MNAALRRELGAHLRAAREQVRPAAVGLVGGGRRRVPGLRREEVAAVAGVSVGWYTWLEQGRASPTRQVLDAICQALGMDAAAHRHTLALAGFRPATPLGAESPTPVGASTLALLDGLEQVPAALLDARMDVLAGNGAYRCLWGDPHLIPAERRNALLLLAAPDPVVRFRPVDPEPLLRGLYEQFRADTGHVPDDVRAAEIVALLTAERPDVLHWWSCRSVREFAPVTAELTGPAGPAITLTFSLFRPVAEQGIYLLLQTPADAPSRTVLRAAVSGYDPGDPVVVEG